MFFFSAFYLVFGEIGKDFVVDGANQTLVDGDAEKECHHAFCDRHDVNTVIAFVTVPFVGIDFLSVLPDHNLTDVWLVFFYKLV